MIKEIKDINKIMLNIKKHNFAKVYELQEEFVKKNIKYYNSDLINDMHSLHVTLYRLERENLLENIDYTFIYSLWASYKDFIMLYLYNNNMLTSNKLRYQNNLIRIRDMMEKELKKNIEIYLNKYTKMCIEKLNMYESLKEKEE